MVDSQGGSEGVVNCFQKDQALIDGAAKGEVQWSATAQNGGRVGLKDRVSVAA